MTYIHKNKTGTGWEGALSSGRYVCKSKILIIPLFLFITFLKVQMIFAKSLKMYNRVFASSCSSSSGNNDESTRITSLCIREKGQKLEKGISALVFQSMPSTYGSLSP